jgi:hypothetical protein
VNPRLLIPHNIHQGRANLGTAQHYSEQPRGGAKYINLAVVGNIKGRGAGRMCTLAIRACMQECVTERVRSRGASEISGTVRPTLSPTARALGRQRKILTAPARRAAQRIASALNGGARDRRQLTPVSCA